MKIKKLTTYVAASLAIVASSIAPTHAATLTSGGGVLEGDATNDNVQQLLTTLFNDPNLLTRATRVPTAQNPNPEYIGVTGSTQLQITPFTSIAQNGPPVTAEVDIPIQQLTTDNGGILTGNAGASIRANAGGALQLGSRSVASLANPRQGSVDNGSLAFSILDSSIQASGSGLAGLNTVDLDLKFFVDGSASTTGIGLAGAAAGLSVNNEPFVPLTNSLIVGDAAVERNRIRIPVNSVVPFKLAFGTVAYIPGGPNIPSTAPSSGSAEYGRTFTLIGVDFVNPTTGAIIPEEQVNLVTPEGINIVQAAQVGEQLTAVPEPPATLGLLILGAGLVGSTQLKKLKLANKKLAK